nr:MAG TPA: hypothetical protein [Bacteriophage sp.]
MILYFLTTIYGLLFMCECYILWCFYSAKIGGFTVG